MQIRIFIKDNLGGYEEQIIEVEDTATKRDIMNLIMELQSQYKKLIDWDYPYIDNL